MIDRQLHIISFIVPYPVNYGGVFDIYNKIVALHSAGIQVHLHCFTENGRKASEIEKYCATISYYPRKKGVTGISHKLPYIVASRMDMQLWKRLEQDDHPVLIEGIHSAAWLIQYKPTDRKIILRLHNVEHDYYRQLFLSSSSTLKKIYYHIESMRLAKFEESIAQKPSLIVAVTQKDAETYKQRFGVTNISVLPVFTGFKRDSTPAGTGYFCLYHGNLSVPENEKAVAWLLTDVFSDLQVPFVIAGKNPSPALKQFIARFSNAELVVNPSHEKMQSLIADAQCNVLPSFNNTGVKLKIINALFHGRHCVVNRAAVSGSGMESICQVAKSRQHFKTLVQELWKQPLTDEEIISRRNVLSNLYDDDKNCQTLIRLIW